MKEWIYFIQTFVLLLLLHILLYHLPIQSQSYQISLSSPFETFTQNNLIKISNPQEELLKYVKSISNKNIKPISSSEETKETFMNSKKQDTIVNKNETRIQGIIPGNFYEDNYNEVNFPANVSNISNMFSGNNPKSVFEGKTVNELQNMYPENEKNIPNLLKNKNKVFTNKEQLTPHLTNMVLNDTKMNFPTMWNYENDLVMNGAPMGSLLKGYDSFSGGYATFEKNEITQQNPQRKKLLPSTLSDDLRYELGITKKDSLGSYQ